MYHLLLFPSYSTSKCRTNSVKVDTCHAHTGPPIRTTIMYVPSLTVPFLHAGKPFIIAVYPHEGWTSGGTRVCIVGMNFYEGVEVVFGTLSASAEVRRLGATHTLLRRRAVRSMHLPWYCPKYWFPVKVTQTVDFRLRIDVLSMGLPTQQLSVVIGH